MGRDPGTGRPSHRGYDRTHVQWGCGSTAGGAVLMWREQPLHHLHCYQSASFPRCAKSRDYTEGDTMSRSQQSTTSEPRRRLNVSCSPSRHTPRGQLIAEFHGMHYPEALSQYVAQLIHNRLRCYKVGRCLTQGCKARLTES